MKNHKRLVKLLCTARMLLPFTQEELDKKAKASNWRKAKSLGVAPDDFISIHVGGSSKEWSYASFVENREYGLAWDELAWVGQHVKSWPGDMGTAFWQMMAMAAREMIDE